MIQVALAAAFNFASSYLNEKAIARMLLYEKHM